MMIDLRKIFGRELRSKVMYALKFLPDKMYLNIFYFSTTGKLINFKNPKGFNEKQQWLKVNDRRPEFNKIEFKVHNDYFGKRRLLIEKAYYYRLLFYKKRKSNCL